LAIGWPRQAMRPQLPPSAVRTRGMAAPEPCILFYGEGCRKTTDCKGLEGNF
jgi:hypothetical protein